MVSGHLCWVRNKPIPRNSCVDKCSSSPVPDDHFTYCLKILIDLTISLIVGKYMCASSLNCVRLCATPWTVACQAPLSMGFSRQEYWSGLPSPPPGDFPEPGIEPKSPALAGRFFTTSVTWEAQDIIDEALNPTSNVTQLEKSRAKSHN